MKSRDTSQYNLFALLAFLTAISMGLILGKDAISWGGSIEYYRYTLCIIIGAVGGLTIGLAGRPRAGIAIIFCYLGLPLGIAISSIAYAIEQGLPINDIASIPLLAVMLYIVLPFLNLFCTWSFILSLLIMRALNLLIKRLSTAP